MKTPTHDRRRQSGRVTAELAPRFGARCGLVTAMSRIREARSGRGGIIAPMSDPNQEVETPAPFKPDQTQPLRAIKRRRPWRSILLGVLGVLVLLTLGGLGGYTSGIAQRKTAQSTIISQAAPGAVSVRAGRRAIWALRSSQGTPRIHHPEQCRLPGRAERTGQGAGSAHHSDADADESTDAHARYAGRTEPVRHGSATDRGGRLGRMP